MDSWLDHFMKMAHLVSERSKDPSSKVGCVIVNDKNQLLSTGYNGFARGVNDDSKILNDREQKYPRIIHAELNAILNCGHSVEGAFAYVTHPPCSQCAAVMIQAGISAIFYHTPNAEFMLRFQDSLNISIDMCNQAGVGLYEIVKDKVDV